MGHLIDFDHSKVTQQFEPQVIGNHERIKESLRQPLHEDFEESVIFQAEKMIGNPTKAINYLTGLLVDIVPTRPLSFSDLWWYEEVHACPPFEKSTHVSF